ncbi:SapB/AmfS family lanthipeptide [Streptomyces sp. NPDC093591]
MSLLELQEFEPDTAGILGSNKGGGSRLSALACGHAPSNLSLTICGSVK